MNKRVIVYSILCGWGSFLFLSFNASAQEAKKVPSWADTLKRPFPATPEVLLEGKKIYTTYCASCHGKSGLGDGAPGITFAVKPANFHSKEVRDQKDGSLFWILKHGMGGMPAYDKALSEEQRWQVLAYVRQLGGQGSGIAGSTKPENSIPVTGLTIDPAMKSKYFPLPRKVSNAVRSESQLFMIDTVASDLKLPWSMAFLPDGSALIAERAGKLLRVKNGKIQKNPIRGQMPDQLRDVKLHPKFEENHLVYISYYVEPVKPDGGYTALMRARLEGDSLVESRVLYKVGPFKENGFWYGSKIAFDGDGYLYLTIGQRTIDGRHRWKTAQDKTVPSGKIMRFKDDGSIPADNPFVDSVGALPEIYSLGHRQPEGLVFDPHTGKLWETEHGEMGGCELNIIRSGGNYGWPDVTFSLNYDGTIITKDTAREGMESPEHHWIPALAPSDMAFTYGDRYPGWNGDLFVGSLVQKMLNRSIMKDGRVVGDEKILQNIGRVRDVKFGPDEFLYVLTEDTGLLVRLVPVKKANVKKPVKKIAG